MSRRKTKNITGLPRIEGILYHDAWISFVCVKCSRHNLVRIGRQLLIPLDTYETAVWSCVECGFVHSKDANLPFNHWPNTLTDASLEPTQRYWQAFFRASTAHPETYWKQCNACGRILPRSDFSKHQGWGPLERQMECKACKAVINAILNPKRTKQQLHESSVRRRVADMFLEDQNEKMNHEHLFTRFSGKCFKTGKKLDINDRESWAIDHILPSTYLYPLTKENAALLSKEANDSKRDKWPSEFYTNHELILLAKITGADLSILSLAKPIINPKIDVNACVERTLQVRERSDLNKRIVQLRLMLGNYGLVQQLSEKNKKLLGL